MIYGTMTKALEYSKAGKIDEWMQLFLRNDGDNIGLADGLLKEPRIYLPIREIPAALLDKIKSGAPEYLEDQDSIDYFFYIVDKMKAAGDTWDTPPLIVMYDENGFYVCDGRHRLEYYRQLKQDNIPVALWVTGEKNYNELIDILNKNQ